MNGTTLTYREHSNDVLALEQWNKELALILLPDTICLAVYLLIGILGNSTVLYVYVRRIRCESRFFIPVLSAIDLVAVILSCPFSMSINLLPVRFDSDVACKIMWFFGMVAVFISVFTLLIIAVDRYRKICKPFGKQMTREWKRLSLVICLIVDIILSMQCFFFYGSAPVKKHNSQLIGLRCTSVTSQQSIAAYIVKSVYALIGLTVWIALIVLYSLIARTLFKQRRLIAKKRTVMDTQLSARTESSSVREEMHNEERQFTQANKNSKMCVAEFIGKKKIITNQTPQSADIRCGQRIPGFRISVMFMVITVVYIVSNLPHLSLVVCEALKKDFWQTMSDSDIALFRFLYTMFMINNIANPFIY